VDSTFIWRMFIYFIHNKGIVHPQLTRETSVFCYLLSLIWLDTTPPLSVKSSIPSLLCEDVEVLRRYYRFCSFIYQDFNVLSEVVQYLLRRICRVYSGTEGATISISTDINGESEIYHPCFFLFLSLFKIWKMLIHSLQNREVVTFERPSKLSKCRC
jgi:hypothetical protein